jgi:hypothetical protein
MGRAIEQLLLGVARENRSWGYDRIVGALANLGHVLSDQTVGNILKRHGVEPAPARRPGTTWKEFLAAHRDVLAATDFFTAEIWTVRAFSTSRGAGSTWPASPPIRAKAGWPRSPATSRWRAGASSRPSARSCTTAMASSAAHSARSSGAAESAPSACPLEAPTSTPFAERWVRSVKEECLDRLVIFGERALRRVLDEYVAHYHHERNHQGLDNRILEPTTADRAGTTVGVVRRRTRLGGLLSFYHRAA